MATPTNELIHALGETADRIESGERYRWSHMGSCNCGHLAQSLTPYSHAEIHAQAMRRSGDWSEQVIDYCPTSGYRIDSIIESMLAVGMTTDDIRHLEKLSDQKVLRRFPIGERHLRHNYRDDVVKYIREWAAMLDEELAAKSAAAPAPAVRDMLENEAAVLKTKTEKNRVRNERAAALV